MPVLTYDKTVQVLNSYTGRDRALRTLYFAISYWSTKTKVPEFEKALNLLISQLSRARLIFRQLNQPSLLKATYEFLNHNKAVDDPVDHSFNGTITLSYALSCVCEFIAWLSDLKVLPTDASRWFKYCLCLWVMGLFATILKSLRNVLSHPYKESYNDRLNLAAAGCDFVFAVNLLPFPFLWSGKLSKRTNSYFGMVASLIGLLRLF